MWELLNLYPVTIHWQEIALYVAGGFIFSILLTVSGVGAGLLMVPFLLIALQQPTLVAVGTVSFFAFVVKVGASALHIRLHTVHYPTFSYVIIGAVPAILSTLLLVNLLIGLGYSPILDQVAKWVVIAVLVGSLVSFFIPFNNNQHSKLPKKFFMTAGAGIGAMMSITGIGGGAVIMALIRSRTQLTTKQIVGTSMLIASLLGMVISAMYAQSNNINWQAVVFMLAGTLLSMPCNSFFIRLLPDKIIEQIIRATLFLALLALLYQTL